MNRAGPSRRPPHRSAPHRTRGVSTVETIIVAPVLMTLGLGTVQAGLVYHAKSILNYATFEAARTGATTNAQPGPMRKELGARLAPLLGGDGSTTMAAAAIARSIVEIDSPVNLDGSVGPPTRLEILNPSEASFADHGKPSLETENRTVIPNSHLRHQGDVVGGSSGQTLQDANLLKIEVTHGFELKVPFVGPLFARLMFNASATDTSDGAGLRAAHYATGRLPLTAVATVRMQSEAWSDSIAVANAEPAELGTPDALADPADTAPSSDPDADPDADADADGEESGEEGAMCDANGLPASIDGPEPVAQSCPVVYVGGTGSC